MEAPGAPGIPPTWTSSDKDMVGASLGPSRLWFTVGHGVVNEIYWPRVDIPQIRDLGFIVADGKGFWSEVKRGADYTIATPGPGIPAVQILHRHCRFELALRIAPDPDRDVLLIELDLTGDADLAPYALLAPHLGGTGNGNRAEVFTNRGRVALCAEQGPFGLALAAADPGQRDAWRGASAGYVGTSDGWQDFARNGAMTWAYDRAGPGNVALMGKLPRHSVLALGFGSGKEAAATLAISALARPFEAAWREQVRAWEAWHAEKAHATGLPGEFHEQVHLSAMVLKAHQDKTYPGAMVASLSIPWGNSTDDPGGYHLVWPRDLVESAGALLELGAAEEARDALRYLIATQLDDGRWAQNQWLGGMPRWGGIQLDEVGFPVLLAAALAEREALGGIEAKGMVRRALAYLARHGPATEQDRWEETAGINPFTLAVAIAALVAGAEFLDEAERGDVLLLADDWNARIEEWCVASGSALGAAHGVEAHYVRVAPARVMSDPAALREVVPLKNRDRNPGLPAAEQVSTDLLQLVRFGLRRADDPFVRGTVRLVDAVLRAETPSGPVWRRYGGDGYGEHPDGRPYDGTGQGRPWPLLAGERGHYALVAAEDPVPHLRTMMRASGRLGLIPEQVWDGDQLPLAGLHPGRPSGSAMPLVWAHAEFVKLATSIRAGRPVDRPEAVWLRYAGRRPHPTHAHWAPWMPVATIRPGQSLRVLSDVPTVVRWRVAGRDDAGEATTALAALGLHATDLPTGALRPGDAILVEFAHTVNGERRIEVTEPVSPSV
ncbi:glycoside hydrolase family 15 protein [Roseicella aquatilis]|nr:glycoside hydrolase family 15 protein [Roseicella aquatilis]